MFTLPPLLRPFSLRAFRLPEIVVGEPLPVLVTLTSPAPPLSVSELTVAAILMPPAPLLVMLTSRPAPTALLIVTEFVDTMSRVESNCAPPWPAYLSLIVLSMSTFTPRIRTSPVVVSIDGSVPRWTVCTVTSPFQPAAWFTASDGSSTFSEKPDMTP